MKDVSYFSHDANARLDPKIIKIRQKYKWGGYGIFFGIIEILRNQENYQYPLSELGALAFDMQCDCNALEYIVKESELFENDGVFFWSNSLRERLEATIRKARHAAQERWRKQREKEAEEMQEHANALRADASAMPKRGKERIGEEKKKELHKGKCTLYDAYLDYYQMRKDIKTPLTDVAITRMAKKLLELSGSKSCKMHRPKMIAILEQSIINGWKGVFPLKDNSVLPVNTAPGARCR